MSETDLHIIKTKIESNGEATSHLKALLGCEPRVAQKYVIDLAKKHTNELGFIPSPRIKEYIKKRRVYMEFENGEPCGYLIRGPFKPVTKIYQTCIQYDAQRRRHGFALLGRLIRDATRAGVGVISLFCADDLEANKFWKQAGFTFAGKRQGGESRDRMHNRWVMYLNENLLL